MSDNAVELGLWLHNLCTGEDVPSHAAMQSLIYKGADVNTKDTFGQTVLMACSRFGHLVAVKTLLAAAEDINIYAENVEGCSALSFAILEGHAEIVEELSAAHKKFDPNFDINDEYVANDISTWTVLMYSCWLSHVEIVKLLLSIPQIDINMENYEGETALDCVRGAANEDEMRGLFQGEFLPLQL
jgi:ankyrin repeat protein